MTILEFTPIVFVISLFAGFLGSLTGLGGGVVVTPALTILLGVDIRYAIGASLVSVIATSSGAAAAYVRDGYSNMRIGMFLEIATTVGAVCGAFLATHVPVSALSIVFGVVLLHAAWQSNRRHQESAAHLAADPLSRRLRLEGSLGSGTSVEKYRAGRVKTGFSIMFARGNALGVIRDRLRRFESNRNGPGDANPL